MMVFIVISWPGVPVLKEDGSIREWVGTCIDITERKQMEKALQESEEKWRSLVENAPNVILIVDRDGKIQFINRTVIDGSPEEIIGRSIYNYIDPKYHNEVRKTIEQVFQTGEGGGYEVSGTGPDGGTSWYKTEVGPIKNVEQVVSVTLITTDITEIKKTEESLRKSEEKYRSLFDNARDLILTVDLEGNITSANNILREYGYDKNELIGKSLFNVFPKEYLQRFRDFFRDFNQGKPVEGEFKIKSKAKQEDTIVEYKGNPIIQNNKAVGVQIIIRDITESKKMEEKLKQYSEHLEEMVQKRTEELLESEKKILGSSRRSK